MLKTSRKPLLVAVLLLCIAAGGFAAYSYLFVTSNVVHVDVQYVAALTASVTGSTITLDAAVTNNAVPVGAGLNVDFYYSIDAGVTWTYFASQLTDSGGMAQAIYTVTVNGAYDFRAVVTVP